MEDDEDHGAGEEAPDQEWSDAHKVVLAVFRQRGRMQVHEAKDLWTRLWQRFEPDLLSRGVDKHFATGWARIVDEVNKEVRPLGFELRKDRDQRKHPMVDWWFFVNVVDDASAKLCGGGAHFDPIALAFLNKLIGVILAEGSIGSSQAINLSSSVSLGSGVMEAHKQLSKDEAEVAIEQFVALGYLEHARGRLELGLQAFQDLRPLFQARQFEVSAEVRAPFAWVKPHAAHDNNEGGEGEGGEEEGGE